MGLLVDDCLVKWTEDWERGVEEKGEGGGVVYDTKGFGKVDYSVSIAFAMEMDIYYYFSNDIIIYMMG
jgi:hypothetical protein